MLRPIPVYATRRRGFSLVLSLTVMAMLLLLCISVAALMAVELRVARASVSQSRARLNALAGARIALGELQRLVGPDQRVTATADILATPTATDPSASASYEGLNGNRVYHPRWVGVWNSGAVEDVQVPNAKDTEQHKVIQRTTHGYLMDSRYVGSHDWQTDRAAPGNAAQSKRMLGWLVSGAEALPVTRTASEKVNPYAPLPSSDSAVLLGSGVLGDRFSPGSELDMLGARVPVVRITDPDGMPAGEYAYWVSDEGVKARFDLVDRFESTTASNSSPANGGYARLLRLQRYNFDLARSPIADAPSLPKLNFAESTLTPTPNSFGELAMRPESQAFFRQNGIGAYYHDLTFDSATVRADVVKGGLCKDLTAFLTSGTNGIPAEPSVTGSGLLRTDPIISADALAPISPKFGLLANWWQSAPAMSSGAAVAATGPSTYDMPYRFSADNFNANFASQFRPIPTVPYPGGTLDEVTLKVPDFANQTSAARSPVVAQFSMHITPVFNDLGVFATANQAQVLYRPVIVLWNPYSVPLQIRSPKLHYLNNRYVFGNIWTYNSYTFYGHRSRLTFELPSNLVLQPGQSKVFVAESAAPRLPNGETMPVDTQTTTGNQALSSATIVMKPGLPDGTAYYRDSLTAIEGSRVNVLIFEGTPAVPVSKGPYYGTHPQVPNPAGYASATLGLAVGKVSSGGTAAFGDDYDETKRAAEQVFLTDGESTLQQVNMDSHLPLTPIVTGNVYTLKNVPQPGAAPAISLSRSPAISPDWQIGFRLKRLDDSESAITGGGASSTGATSSRTLTIAPIADANVRSPRQSRYPFDAIDLISPDAVAYGGIWTGDHQLTLPWPAAIKPTADDRYVPFYATSSASSGSYPGCVLFDVPYSDIGILSLGQLRHAPLNILPYGPSFAFGTARIPVPGKGSVDLSMQDRTGCTQDELRTAWAKLNWQGQGLVSVNQRLRQLERFGAAQVMDIYDIAYELNHHLWDGFTVSGIHAENGGWIANAAWQNATPTVDLKRSLPDSRHLPILGAESSDALFTSVGYKLYKPAYTLLEKGSFNVNSTSVVAWTALLSAFRNMPVPTRENGDVTPTGTPYLRHLRPKSGEAKSSDSFAETTWSGFRSLSDEDILTLAKAMVARVREQGPFLSIADFVNRRLRKPTEMDFAAWESEAAPAEAKYLGAIEGAIVAAGLNKAYDNDSRIDRTTAETGLAATASLPREPRFRSKHRIAGTPGYLDQSDILQQIGSALTARSDTFKIRAMGKSDDGAVAYVELTVQRMPHPVIPADRATGGLPINPKAVTTDGAYTGNQYLGRRMHVVSTRWLAASDI